MPQTSTVELNTTSGTRLLVGLICGERSGIGIAGAGSGLGPDSMGTCFCSADLGIAPTYQFIVKGRLQKNAKTKSGAGWLTRAGQYCV
jgi:hypothetical protein